MALIVEDGSNVANSNSYASLTDIRAFASARGVTLPSDDGKLEILAVKAMDYLESFRKQFQGSKTNNVGDDPAAPKVVPQSLQWPRIGVVIDDEDFDANSIPAELKKAQMQYCMELFGGNDAMPTTTGAFVKREKVGPLETEYSETLSSDSPRMPKVDALLEPLLRGSGGFTLTCVRM